MKYYWLSYAITHPAKWFYVSGVILCTFSAKRAGADVIMSLLFGILWPLEVLLAAAERQRLWIQERLRDKRKRGGNDAFV